MRLRFQTRLLADVCNRGSALDRKWGGDVATAVRRRLSLLAGVPTLELLKEFPGAIGIPIKPDTHYRIAIEVVRNCHIIVQPDHNPIPYLLNGELACKLVECLIIVEVNGYGC
jgi:hypothetical protein